LVFVIRPLLTKKASKSADIGKGGIVNAKLKNEKGKRKKEKSPLSFSRSSPVLLMLLPYLAG
jgi:hypothetical protein